MSAKLFLKVDRLIGPSAAGTGGGQQIGILPGPGGTRAPVTQQHPAQLILPDAPFCVRRSALSWLSSQLIRISSGISVFAMAAPAVNQKPEPVSISPLLQRLAYPAAARPAVGAEEIASAFALIFEDRLSDIQTAALLTLLHSTGLDRDAEVIAKCSHRMREAATKVDKPALKRVIKARGKKEGNYNGGVVRNALYLNFSG